ncbi:hypothetical protein [Massilia varians]|uniref:hypothetical protein n=1 Tax=Massilia varians TaxID=457921 RepID=UPI0025563C4F|nr:hypothetical protein [Massilia varians]MDK6079650.1 hypothetical protein [Massilia varians]
MEVEVNGKIVPAPTVHNTKEGDWHLVWGWWPVPLFTHALLGTDGCRNLVVRVNERTIMNRLLIWFALELEHRQQPITAETELEAALSKVCATGFDLRPAAELHRAVSDAKWARLARECEENIARLPRTPDHPEVFQSELQAKKLPAGRSANMALMRAILAARTKDD